MICHVPLHGEPRDQSDSTGVVMEAAHEALDPHTCPTGPYAAGTTCVPRKCTNVPPETAIHMGCLWMWAEPPSSVLQYWTRGHDLDF